MGALISVARSLRILLVASLTLTQQGSAKEKQKCAEPQTTTDSTYSPGQVWSYKARPGEDSSTVTILRVERAPTIGVVIHVRIDGVQFGNCTGGPAPTTVQHAPFTKAAIDKSVTRKLRTISELPAFEAGYKDWLSHCGGVYTFTLAEMVAADDATFNAGLGCKI